MRDGYQRHPATHMGVHSNPHTPVHMGRKTHTHMIIHVDRPGKGKRANTTT